LNFQKKGGEDNMKKKIAALAGAGVMLASMVGPAFGFYQMGGGCWGGKCHDDGDLSIVNQAVVNNNVNTQASTGYVTVGGMRYSRCHHMPMGSMVSTGDALARSNVYTQANWNEVDCDCVDGDVTIRNRATVNNRVNTQASSGYIMAKSGWVMTGNAGAHSVVDSVVNTNLLGVAY
jgi:hypothetical protein